MNEFVVFVYIVRSCIPLFTLLVFYFIFVSFSLSLFSLYYFALSIFHLLLFFLCLYGNKLCILWPINFETLKLETVYYSQCFFSLYLFYMCSILSYTMYFDYKIGFHVLLERPSNVNRVRSPLNLLFLFSLQISPS